MTACGSGLLAGIVALAGLLAAEPPFPEVVRARVPSSSVLKLIPAESQPVGMAAAEFDGLLEEARKLAEERARGPRLLAMHHRARWRDGVLIGTTELTIAHGNDGAGWLPLRRWSPAVTASPAPLAADESERLEVRVEGAGVRATTLEWRQAAESGSEGLSFALEFPDAPVATFRLEPPEGATVVSPVAREEADGLWIDQGEGRWALRLRPTTFPTTPPPLEPDLGGRAVVEVQGTSASWISEWRLDNSARDGRPVILQLDPAIEHVEVSGSGVRSRIVPDPAAGTRVELVGEGGLDSSPRAIVRGRVRIPERGAWTLPSLGVIGRTWDAPRTLVSLGNDWKLTDCRERAGRRVEVTESDRERVAPRGLLLAFVGVSPGPVADLVLHPPRARGTAEVLGRLDLGADRASFDAQVSWTYDEGLPPRLGLDVPGGWLIESVEGDDVDWRLEAPPGGPGLLELAGGEHARGTPLRIRVKAVAPLAPDVPFALPRLRPRDVAVTDESWTLAADAAAWDVCPIESSGLAWKGAPAGDPAAPIGGLALGWRWLAPDARGSLEVRPRRESRGPDLLQVIALEPDRLRVGSLIRWERPPGGPGTIRLGWRDLPAGVVPSWREVDAAGGADEPLVARPAPQPSPGPVAWFDVDLPDRADAPVLLAAAASVPWKGTGEVPLIQSSDPRAMTRLVLSAPARYDIAWEGAGWIVPESVARPWLESTELPASGLGLPTVPAVGEIYARVIGGAGGPLRLDARAREEEPARGFLLGLRDSSQSAEGRGLLHRLAARVVRGDEDALRIVLPEGAKLERLELAGERVFPEREGDSLRLPLPGGPGSIHPLAIDYLAGLGAPPASFSLPAFAVEGREGPGAVPVPRLGEFRRSRPGEATPPLADWGWWGLAGSALVLLGAGTARLRPWARLASIGACVLLVALWARWGGAGAPAAALGGALLGAVVVVAWGAGRLLRRAAVAAIACGIAWAGMAQFGIAGGRMQGEPGAADVPNPLLALVPYDRPDEAIGPAARVVLKRADADWLRAAAVPPRAPTPSLRLISAEHRVSAAGDGAIAIVSALELEWEGEGGAAWKVPLGAVPESRATLDGARVPIRVEDRGRSGVIAVVGKGWHRLELSRSAPLPPGGRVQVPVNPHPGAIAIVEAGAGIEVIRPRGGVREGGDGVWLGPARELTIQGRTAAPAPGPIAEVDGNWLWDAEVGGDCLRGHLAIRSAQPVSELQLRLAPGSAVRSIGAPGTVSVSWKKMEGGQTWSAQFSPALPDGSRIELELWKPELTAKEELRRPPIPSFANATSIRGLLGFRRPSFRSERLSGREVIPDDEFAAAWGAAFGGEGLGFAGAVRYAGAEELGGIGVRFAPEPARPLVRQRARLGIEAGRLVFGVDAELGDDLMLPREASALLPADLTPTRVEGDGLTDWAWEAEAGRLRLRFDGPPLGMRLIHIEGIVPAPSPSYARPLPWPRWEGMREEPGELSLRAEGRRSVALSRKGADGAIVRIKPDPEGKYRIDAPADIPQLEVSAPSRQLDVLITSRVTTFADGATWDAALEVRSLDGAIPGISFRVPRGWSDRLAWGGREGRAVGEVLPDGEGARLTLRPESPSFGPWRVWLRSESRGEPSGLRFPDLIPLGEGTVDTYLAWADASDGRVQLSEQEGVREVTLRSGSPVDPPYRMPPPKTFQIQAVPWSLEFTRREKRAAGAGPLGLRFRGAYDPASGAWGQVDAERLAPGVGLRLEFPDPVEPLISWVGDRVVRPIRLSPRSWRIPGPGAPETPLRSFWLAKGAVALPIPATDGAGDGRIRVEVDLPPRWSISAGGVISWERADGAPESDAPSKLAPPAAASLPPLDSRWRGVAGDELAPEGRTGSVTFVESGRESASVAGSWGLISGALAALAGITSRIRPGRRGTLLAWSGSLAALAIAVGSQDPVALTIAALAGLFGYGRGPRGG
jgi:hypothetical protein